MKLTLCMMLGFSLAGCVNAGRVAPAPFPPAKGTLVRTQELGPEGTAAKVQANDTGKVVIRDWQPSKAHILSSDIAAGPTWLPNADHDPRRSAMGERFDGALFFAYDFVTLPINMILQPAHKDVIYQGEKFDGWNAGPSRQ